MNFILKSILVAGCTVASCNIKPVFGYAYNLEKIPSGYWTYYERDFKTQVVYFRDGNNMSGRMGNTCFSAKIYPNTVRVNWWGRVPRTLRNNYSISAFTADNMNQQPTDLKHYQDTMNYCQ